MQTLRLFLLACIGFYALPSTAQMVKTKDGVAVGKRSKLIEVCIQKVEEKLVKMKGYDVKADKYCSCFIDSLIPNIDSKEFERVLEEDGIANFMTNKDNLNAIMKCVKGNTTLDADYQFGTSEDAELEKKVAVVTCVEGVLKNAETSKMFTRSQAQIYCDCFINKLYDGGYTYSDALHMSDIDNPAMKEIAFPCMTKATGNKASPSDCRSLKMKKLKYFDKPDKTAYLIFNDHMHIEYLQGGKYQIKSKLTWVNDCEFNAEIISVTVPDFPYSVGEVMNVKIEKIEDGIIYSTGTLRGESFPSKLRIIN